MPRGVAEAVNWARTTGVIRRSSYPNGPLYNRGDWEGGCAAHVKNSSDTIAYDSALEAAVAAGARRVKENGAWVYVAGLLDPDPSTAWAGEVHYWWNVVIGGTDYGHTGRDVNGGASSILMASNAVTINYGHNSGVVSLSDYGRRKPAPRYLGHAPRFGVQAVPVTAPTGGGVTPIDPTDPLDDIRRRLRRDDMIAFTYTPLAGNWQFLIGDGRIKNAPDSQAQLWHDVSVGNLGGPPNPAIWGVNSSIDLARMLYDAGFDGSALGHVFAGYDEVSGALIAAEKAEDFVQALSGGHGALAPYRVAKAAAAVPPQSIDYDVLAAKVAALIHVPTQGTLTLS